MQYEFVITFVTVVQHFTADPLFLLIVQNGTPRLTASAVTLNYRRDNIEHIRWTVPRIQKSCRDPFSVLQVHEPCDENPRSSGLPWQPEGSDTLATSCLLHSACRQLKHMCSLRSNNNERYVTKWSVTIVSLIMNDGFRISLCERRITVNNLRQYPDNNLNKSNLHSWSN